MNSTQQHLQQPTAPQPPDEGGLRPPPGLSFWGRVWWWFDFLILVKLARLRFVAILLVIGLIITQWDLLTAYYEKWTRPAGAAAATGSSYEWFCPMHPSIIRDNDREKCPICFMPLSKRKKGEPSHAEPLPAGVVSRVQLSPYRVVLAGVSTWEVDYVPLAREVVAAGLVEFNERGRKTVSSRVKGRIDELLASETGRFVQAGDVLASVYSQDLLVTVKDLLRAHESGSQTLERDARRRLELLGIDAQQIDEILRTGQANTHLKIRSPITGHIINKFVREGDYVEEGTALYDVADLSTVWIQAQVYEDDIPLVLTTHGNSHAAHGDMPRVAATTRAFPGEEFDGKLSFIYPHVDQASRTLTVRFEVANPEPYKLRPGSTATVRLYISAQQMAELQSAATSDEPKEQLAQGKVLAVPQSAVIDTGDQKIVYRQVSPGVFEGVRVTLGPKMINPHGVIYFPVLSGLSRGEQIVLSGSFLVDAETRLNPAAGSIYFGGSGGPQSATGGAMVRPTTPEDSEAKIDAALAALTPADRELAKKQQFCPVLPTSRLGSMGAPVKLLLDGEPVFVCCSGCTKQATNNAKATAEKARELRRGKSKSPQTTGGQP